MARLFDCTVQCLLRVVYFVSPVGERGREGREGGREAGREGREGYGAALLLMLICHFELFNLPMI